MNRRHLILAAGVTIVAAIVILLNSSEASPWGPGSDTPAATVSGGDSAVEPSGVGGAVAEVQPEPQREPVGDDNLTPIVGRVTGPSGQGIGGAGVRMRILPDGGLPGAFDVTLDPTTPSGEIRGEVRVPFRTIDYRATVEIEGYTKGVRVVRGLPIAAAIDLGEIGLDRGHPVAGRVTEWGTPIGVPDVRVVLTEPYGEQTFSTPSDASGAFRFSTTLRSDRYRVSARGSKSRLRIEAPRELSITETSTDLNIEIAPLSGLLFGQVIDETTQETVPSASITVGTSPHVAAVGTDRRGEYAIHAAAAWTGGEQVQVSADTHHAPVPFVWWDVVRSEGRIYVRPNTLVWFAAHDARTGEPLEQFDLIIPHGFAGQGILNKGLVRSEIVDDRGSSRRGITLPSGMCVVRVTAAGHVPAHVVFPAQASGQRVTASTVRLTPTVRLSCEVVDSAGRPVSGCGVEAIGRVSAGVSEAVRVVEADRPLPVGGSLDAAGLEEECAKLAMVIDEATTDAAGLASVSASTSRQARLRVRPPAGRPIWVPLAENDVTAGHVRIVLPAPRVLAGTVGPRAWIDEVWNDGPGMAPGVRVAKSGPGALDLADGILAALGSTTTIDRDGRFEIELGASQGGTWSVVWRVPRTEGGPMIVFQRLGGTVTPDLETLAVDMSAFMLGTATGEIRGAGDEEVRLSARSPLQGTVRTRTDADGRFDLRLPGGTYSVAIQSSNESRWITLERDWSIESGATQAGAWEPGGAEVRIRAQRPVTPASWWGIVDSQGNRRASAITADGDIVLRDLQPGAAYVVQGDGGLSSPRLAAFLQGGYGQGRVLGHVVIMASPPLVIEVDSNGRIHAR